MARDKKTQGEEPVDELEARALEAGDAEGEAWARNARVHARRARRLRRFMRRLPSDPRCKLCYAPFGGAGGRLLGVTGFRPSRKNPNLCDVCVEKGPSGGFETKTGVLFGDVRGFTALAESGSPSEVAETMQRFYTVAARTVIKHEGIVDKMVGDEVMALFVPPLMDADPCTEMVSAAEELLRSVGYGSGEAAWLPVGVGVDFGKAYIGNIGTEGMRDFTALGDVVNTAARLQEKAEAGQILLSERVYDLVRDRYPEARQVELELKGKSAPATAYAIAVH